MFAKIGAKFFFDETFWWKFVVPETWYENFVKRKKSENCFLLTFQNIVYLLGQQTKYLTVDEFYKICCGNDIAIMNHSIRSSNSNFDFFFSQGHRFKFLSGGRRGGGHAFQFSFDRHPFLKFYSIFA